jgi:hypothetical protein
MRRTQSHDSPRRQAAVLPQGGGSDMLRVTCFGIRVHSGLGLLTAPACPCMDSCQGYGIRQGYDVGSSLLPLLVCVSLSLRLLEAAYCRLGLDPCGVPGGPGCQ